MFPLLRNALNALPKGLPAGLFALCCMLALARCRPSPKPPARPAALPISRIGARQFAAGRYDSAITTWNAAFAQFRAAGRWDSIYGYEEKYIIAHSRLYRVPEGHAFLDEVSRHLLAQHPVDSIELSKLWVRRSELLYTAGKPELARDTLLAVLQLRQRRLKAPHPLLADACDYLLIAYGQQNDYWTAAAYGEEGARIYKECLKRGWDPRECSNLPWLIGNTGESYNYLGYYDKAISLLQEAYDSLCSSHAPLDSRLYYQIQLGGSYRRKGDYRAAVRMFRAAIDSLQRTDNRSFESDAESQLALCYKETGPHDQMMLYARKQYETSSALHQGTDHTEQAASAALLAECCISAGNLNSAAGYIREALRIYNSHHDTASLDYLNGLTLESRLYQKRGYADSALTLLQKVVRERRRMLGDTNDLVAVALLDEGQVQDAAGRYLASAAAAQSALNIFLRTRNAGHPYIRECLYLMAHARWKRADSKGALKLIGQGTADTLAIVDHSYLHLLELAAQILLPAPESTDTAAWQRSLQSYRQLSAAYRQFLNYSVFEGAHFAEGGTAIQAVKAGFLPAYQLYHLTGREAYLQDALDFAEQSRTGSIRLALQHYEANRFAHVPDTLIAREEDLRIACAYFEKLLLSAQSIHAPAARVQQWTDSLTSRRTAYTAFIRMLSDRYPAYYQLKLSDKTIDLKDLRTLARENGTAIVEYVCVGDRLYAFTCTSDSCSLQELPIARHNLELFTQNYREAMARADAPTFAGAAAELYAGVVAPLAPKLSAAGVCVIPDDVLSYISFESLLTRPVPHTVGFRVLPYAIRQHDWHYAYSATVLAQQSALYGRKQSAQSLRRMVAIAPGFDREVKAAGNGAARDSLFLHLLRQPWAMQLANDLQRQRGASAYTGTTATEDRYNHQSAAASVMYIGTHAFPDDLDPMESDLVFAKQGSAGSDADEDGYLHAYEIYRTPVQMRLLVLGGCETGIGRLRSGEGIVSLASGFAYAGCPSIVMSLWSIDDQQSAGILSRFFRNTAKQQAISQALTDAKRHYLETAGADDALYNPLYWSGLVSIGLNDPVPAPVHSGCLVYWMVGVGLAAMVLALLLVRRRRHARPVNIKESASY